MKLAAFELNEPLPELKQPHALAMLRPWVDVGSLTLSWLEARLASKGLARPGNFFDFTRYRPTIFWKEGCRQVAIPNSYITYAEQEKENDFLFLHLMEPHMLGEVYVDSVLRLLARFGVRRYCLLGGMYDLVPHTRPLLVSGTAARENVEGELEKAGVEPSDYQGPTTIAFLVSQRAPEMGIETMSFIVHLPQYAQLDDDYAGTVRLMKVLGSLYDVPMDEAYLERAERQLEQINLELEKNPQLKALVEQLEMRYDARANGRMGGKPPCLSPEVERFLREMDRRFGEG